MDRRGDSQKREFLYAQVTSSTKARQAFARGRSGVEPVVGSRGESSLNVQRYMTTPYYDATDALTAWAAARGRGMYELAQAWLMAQPQVCSVITGTTRLEHVLHNVTAAS